MIKKIKLIMIIYCACLSLIGLVFMAWPWLLNYVDSWLISVTVLFPNESWSSGSPYPLYARNLFFLSYPVMLLSIANYYVEVLAQIRMKTYSVTLRCMAIIFSIFSSILGGGLAAGGYEGGDVYVFPLSKYLWVLCVLPWLPALLIGVLIGVAPAVMQRAFEKNINGEDKL